MSQYCMFDKKSPSVIQRDFLCGPEGIRTLDLLNAIEARSQLRHRPKKLPYKAFLRRVFF